MNVGRRPRARSLRYAAGSINSGRHILESRCAERCANDAFSTSFRATLTYEKQLWLGRTEQKLVKLDENEQRVFSYGCHGNGTSFSRNPPFNASKGCIKWSKGINYSWETLDFAGLQNKSGNSLSED